MNKHDEWKRKYEIHRDYEASVIGDIDIDSWFIVDVGACTVVAKDFSSPEAAEEFAREMYLFEVIDKVLLV